MSEHQHYEFLAIDKALSKSDMEELRNLSSRAEITSRRLFNEYQYGSFRGSPEALMAKYFDFFMYFANWGTHRIMIRLPLACLEPKAAQPYRVPGRLELTRGSDHLLLEFCSGEDQCDDEWIAWDADDFAPLRNELLSGDLRCLYLGWLAAVSNGEVADEALEPPVPAGLADLSESLTHFTNFLYLETALIEAAAQRSADLPKPPSSADLSRWVAALPEKLKQEWILGMMQGDGDRLGAAAKSLFRQSIRKPLEKEVGARRTAQELRLARDVRQQEKERERTERITAARQVQLSALRGKEPQLWKKVEELAATKLPKSYKEAMAILKDLQDLSRSGSGAEFKQALRQLQIRHRSKSSFMRQLRDHGLATD